jgi:hypothetical protein
MSTPLPIEVIDLADEQIRKEDAWWRQNRFKLPTLSARSLNVFLH